jgi:hypothetical protein
MVLFPKNLLKFDCHFKTRTNALTQQGIIENTINNLNFLACQSTKQQLKI